MDQAKARTLFADFESKVLVAALKLKDVTNPIYSAHAKSTQILNRLQEKKKTLSIRIAAKQKQVEEQLGIWEAHQQTVDEAQTGALEEMNNHSASFVKAVSSAEAASTVRVAIGGHES
jgi:hypothetical protein